MAEILTAQHILATTEDVLRRYGPAKATVADVARALKVSPGSIYRHFPSKVALREAVALDWLDRVHAGLPGIAQRPGPADERLRAWLTTLFETKRGHARSEPELFDTYVALVEEASTATEAHLDDLRGQIETIIRSGVDRGEFHVADPSAAAAAVLSATARFHNPLHAREWVSDPAIAAELTAVVDLLLAGLSAP